MSRITKAATEIPDGWVNVTIEELFGLLEDGRTLHQGWSPQCEDGPSENENDWGVLKTTAIQAGAFLPEHNKRLPANLSPRPLIEVREGDILLTCAGPRARCGVACLVRHTRRRLMMSGKMYRFRVSERYVDARFVEAYLQSVSAQTAIDRMKTGGSDSGLNLTHERFRKLEIPVPPVNEQRRIVAKIEELFTELDAGIESLKKARLQLKRYRQAVLKAAVTGELTREWREAHKGELEPAANLLTRILRERRAKWEADQLAKMQAAGKPPKNEDWKKRYPEPVQIELLTEDDVPEGWVRTNIDNLCVVVRGASPRPAGSPKYFGGNIPWITVGSLTADSKPYLTSVSEFVTEAGREASRYIEPDTLLLTNSGATLGVPKITMIGGCINDGSVALLYLDYPLKLYLYYCLAEMTKKLRQVNQGAAQPNLNTSIVKAIPISLPPFAEQQQIVSEVERLLSIADATELAIEQGLKQAERLRQSILQQAFAGKLVPQDADDEPAEALLARIKAERAASAGVSRKLRRPTRKQKQPAQLDMLP